MNDVKLKLLSHSAFINKFDDTSVNIVSANYPKVYKI